MSEIPNRCRECDSVNLSFDHAMHSGHLSSYPVVFLGCDACSATLWEMPLTQFLAEQTERLFPR
jgi:hypothetical protein